MLGLADGEELRQPLHRLDLAVTELQESVMRARMQPMGLLFDRLPRLVRDIALDTGRKMRLEAEGAETEVDRQVLDLVRDPLTHLVRNAAVHGIESPAERVLQGKPPEGIIRLSVRHEGGQVIVTVSDDGRGLDTAALSRKAAEKGLVPQDKAQALSARQAWQLVFLPGLSTAGEITPAAGRGVGMDIVRDSVEKLGGSVDVFSRPGGGAAFTLRVPLTLSIVPALVVEVEGMRQAIPQAAVAEVLRLTRDGPHRIERMGGSRMLRLRDVLLPLVSLHRLLGLDSLAAKSLNPFVIVIGRGEGAFGILVDRVLSAEDIVTRPAPAVLRAMRLYSGSAVMGDGGVAMILDPFAVADAAGIADLPRAGAGDVPAPAPGKGEPLLLFRAGAEDAAVPLSAVSRLELAEKSAIQTAGGREMLRQEGRLLPLVRFRGVGDRARRRRVPVVVLEQDGRAAGLVVDGITEIADGPPGMAVTPVRGEGVLGSILVCGRALDLADAARLIAAAHGE